MRKLFTTFLVFLVMLSHAQDSQFSQYFAASLYLNPAFSGIYNEPSLHINHKRQLQTSEVVNELTQVSIILPIKSKQPNERSNGGFGLMAFNEQMFQEVYKRNSVFLNYAHNFKFGPLGSYLVSVGVQGGYDMRRLTFNGLKWGSQFNPFIGFDEALPVPVNEFNDQIQNFLLNGGIMYYFNPDRNYFLFNYSGFVGISATNLNRPNTSFSVAEDGADPILLKYNGGIEFKIKKFFVTPSLLFMYLRRNYQYNAGVNLSWGPETGRYSSHGTQLLFGTWYRFRDSFIFMGGIRVNKLTVRASYDMNSALFVENRDFDLAQNSVEISLQYYFSNKRSIKKFSNPLF
ncbi:MAG: PorP/SprF family type IX secretion system membrane protein [Bacteroidota bacterium]